MQDVEPREEGEGRESTALKKRGEGTRTHKGATGLPTNERGESSTIQKEGGEGLARPKGKEWESQAWPKRGGWKDQARPKKKEDKASQKGAKEKARPRPTRKGRGGPGPAQKGMVPDVFKKVTSESKTQKYKYNVHL